MHQIEKAHPIKDKRIRLVGTYRKVQLVLILLFFIINTDSFNYYFTFSPYFFLNAG